jgi:hypothetical protein
MKNYFAQKYFLLVYMMVVGCIATKTFAEEPLFPLIDKQAFSKKTIPASSDNDSRIIFFRASESSELWTQLVEYHHKQLPNINNDTATLAKQLAESVQSLNPEIRCEISQDKKNGAVILTYILWHREMPYQELHVYRFDRAADGKSIYGLQIVKRSEIGEPMEQAIAYFKTLQPSWLKQAEQFDMQKIRKSFQ